MKILGRKKKRPPKERDPSIPEKANKILNLVALVMLLILMRICHVSVIQYESRLEESRKPQRRVIVERAERASIRDRFNLPLAINKVQYNATVIYSQVREVPAVVWKKDSSGKKQKHYKRKEHVSELSEIFAKELEMDKGRVEDLIYGKAALFPNVPYVLKEDISEEEYFRLKILEKDWLGIYAERVPKRVYPQGQVGAHLIGYMGAISREEYLDVIGELRICEAYLDQRENGDNPLLPKGYASHEDLRHRYQDLVQRAYTLNDYVGKTGVEGAFDERLRGFYGKKTYHSDFRGNYLWELPGSREALSGQRILLSISSELQDYAEKLLIENEAIREGRSIAVDLSKNTMASLKQPWVKGGAIVVMDPNTGEVLTMASYPRFDPNAFIPSGDEDENKKKQAEIHSCFETNYHVANIWDGKSTLNRESIQQDDFILKGESQSLTWKNYLNRVLPRRSKVRKEIGNVGTLSQFASIQKDMERLLELSGKNNMADLVNVVYKEPSNILYRNHVSLSDRFDMEAKLKDNAKEVEKIKERLKPHFDLLPYNYDKLLFLDLTRIAVEGESFSDDLLNKVGKRTIGKYREETKEFLKVRKGAKKIAQNLFRFSNFQEWRDSSQKKFLKEKRKEERRKGTYQHPFVDYLDEKERELFTEFWDNYRWRLIQVFLTGMIHSSLENDLKAKPFVEHFLAWRKELSQGAHSGMPWWEAYQNMSGSMKGLDAHLALQYIQTFRGFSDLTRPLWGRYPHLRQEKGVQLEKHLAAAFYPRYGFSNGRSYAFQHATPQGSIFKLVTAYEGIRQFHERLQERGDRRKNLNPLTFDDVPHRDPDDPKKWNVGRTMDGKPIPQYYKGGRLMRTARRHVGKVDVTRALCVSSNPYFALLTEYFKSPEDLNHAARAFSYGERTGLDIPGEVKGQLPDDLSTNRSGLYAATAGQHSLVVTPLQTAMMLSAIANGGRVFKPKLVNLIAGKEPLRGENRVFSYSDYNYKELLDHMGVDFPLFTSLESAKQKNLVTQLPSEVNRTLPFPKGVRDLLLEGMRKVVAEREGGANANRLKSYFDHPDYVKDYSNLTNYLLGKSSSAEIVENVDLDREDGTNRYKHVWFGGISFERDHKAQARGLSVEGDQYGRPELVVVVYLRFGELGREAAPLAAQMVKKWRSLKEKYSS